MRLDPNKNPIYVILFAAAFSGLFTAAIMALHVATKPIVEANRRLLTEKALVDLFALGDAEDMSSEEISDIVRRRVAGLPDPGRPDDPRAQEISIVDEHTGESVRLLVAYRNDLAPNAKPDIYDTEAIKGYAFRIRGAGFWAMIDGYLAVEPSGGKILGIVFLNHQETPGLGGRITEKRFRNQFKGLNISPPAEGTRFVRMGIRKPEKSDPGYARHVDTITGATGTSMGVDKFVNTAIRRFRAVAEAVGLIEPTGTSGPVRK